MVVFFYFWCENWGLGEVGAQGQGGREGVDYVFEEALGQRFEFDDSWVLCCENAVKGRHIGRDQSRWIIIFSG